MERTAIAHLKKNHHNNDPQLPIMFNYIIPDNDMMGSDDELENLEDIAEMEEANLDDSAEMEEPEEELEQN